MVLKGYSAFPKAPELLESHNQIVYFICKTLVGVLLTLCRDAVCVFYSTSQLGLRLIDFDVRSTHLGLFYALRLGNRVHVIIFIITFFVELYLERFSFSFYDFYLIYIYINLYRTYGFMPFPWGLERCETQSASSRTSTQQRQ